MSSFRKTWQAMHTLKFWVILLGVFAWVGVGVWLQIRIGWPDRYGFHCHGRGCLFVDLWHSPALLRGHSIGECAVFLWLWSMPAFLLAVFIWAQLRKRNAPADLPPPENF
jgi:hypothetical protein